MWRGIKLKIKKIQNRIKEAVKGYMPVRVLQFEMMGIYRGSGNIVDKWMEKRWEDTAKTFLLQLLTHEGVDRAVFTWKIRKLILC